MKVNLLKALNEELKVSANKLNQVEVPLIFGSGDPDSAIVLIGEAPGKQEILKGKPFVGQAGKNLDEFIEILGINRSDLYITNVVKIRPYKVNEETGRESNRPPTRNEVNSFKAFLIKELEIVQPILVVTLGNVALKCVLQDDRATIGEAHGKAIELKLGKVEFKLFPLYHPASIIYKADLKETYIQDLYKLKELLKVINLK